MEINEQELGAGDSLQLTTTSSIICKKLQDGAGF